MSHAIRRLLLVAAVVLLGGGCSHSTPASTAAPCPKRSTDTIPAGAHAVPTVDVDGDGKRDTIWFGHRDNQRIFGVKTATGRVSSAVFESASGADSEAFAVNADERGPVEIFVVNRGVYLYAYVDCAITPIRDEQGAPYRLDLGFGIQGTGVGCVDADGDGKRDLVWFLDLDTNTKPVTVHWKRTIVRLDGTHASNGASDTGTYQLPQDQAKVDALHAVTCGKVTPADGVLE